MFSHDLERFGPDATPPPLTLRESRRYCRRLARRHYENFTVASRLLPRPAAAARLQHLRLLPLGRRPGRRDRRSRSAASPCWIGGKRCSAQCYRGPGDPSGVHRPVGDHPRVRHSRSSRFSTCWWPSARTSGSRATRRSTSCWNTAATRPIRWAGWCSTSANATRPSGRGCPIRSARACNWPISGRTWPAIGTAAASICRRRLPAVRLRRGLLRPAGVQRRLSPTAGRPGGSGRGLASRRIAVGGQDAAGVAAAGGIVRRRRFGYAGGDPPAAIRRVDAPPDRFAIRETAVVDRLLVEAAFRRLVSVGQIMSQ